MSGRRGQENRDHGRRPGGRRVGGRPGFSSGSRPRSPDGAPASGKPPLQGSIGLTRLDNGDFELSHPRAVNEVELDYEEGMELWKEGDPESARDALRYALRACHDNLWVHVALGRLALEEFRDPALARGHFGYALELGQRALPHGFSGRLPRDRRNNLPLYAAIDGLLSCLEALRHHDRCASLRALRDRLSRGAAS
jgi:hypothetical protein